MLTERILAERLTDRLAKPRSGLHTWLSRSKTVVRRIPDEFEEAIIFGFVVDDDGRLVDLAANADDVTADDGGSIASRNCLWIG